MRVINQLVIHLTNIGCSYCVPGSVSRHQENTSCPHGTLSQWMGRWRTYTQTNKLRGDLVRSIPGEAVAANAEAVILDCACQGEGQRKAGLSVCGVVRGAARREAGW